MIGTPKAQPTTHYIASQAVLTCDCGSHLPVVIQGLDRAGQCHSCQTKWIIYRIDYLNNQGVVTMNLQVAKWFGPMAATRELDLPKFDTVQ